MYRLITEEYNKLCKDTISPTYKKAMNEGSILYSYLAHI